MSKPIIGVIGIGKMGGPMAANLLEAGYQVVAFNRSPERLDAVVAAGAERGESIADLTARADVILSSLTNQQSVRDVYLADDGVAANARNGQICIETSTNDVALIRAVEGALAQRGARLLDSPVSGGVPGAVAGSLTVMTGGDEDVFETVRPILNVIGQNVHYLGPVGAGTAMKLVNQLLVAVNMAAVAEAVVFGASAGASPDKILEVISTSFGGSRMLDRGVPLIRDRQFGPATPVDLIRKDLGIVVESADANDLPLDISRTVLALFNRTSADGYGENDMTAIVMPLEEDANLRVS